MRRERGETRSQGHRPAGRGDRADVGALRPVLEVRVQAHQRRRRRRGVQDVRRQADTGQQRPVLFRAGADGQVSGTGTVLHGGEHQEGGDDGHDRGRRGRAHVQPGGRRVLHRAQVRDALAEVGQPGRAVRGHQQRGERAGGGHVRVLRADAGRRVPGHRLLQPVHTGPGEGPAIVPGVAEQHRGGRRVLQVAVPHVPGRGAAQAARLQHREAGHMSARLLSRQRVPGGLQQERLQAAAGLAGRAQAAGVDGTVLRAELQDDRGRVRAGRGGQPVRADARAEHRHHVPGVQGQADRQQLRHAGGGRGRRVRGAAGEGRDEDRVQPAGQHGVGQGGAHAHQLLQQRQRVADQGKVRAAGPSHHRPEPGTRVRLERVFEPRQRHAVLVEVNARHHQADIEVTCRLQG